MSDFTITITGSRKIDRRFAKLSKNAEARSTVLKLMGLEMQADTLLTFRDEKDPVTGRPWEDYDELTKNYKGAGAKKLQSTGRLLNAVVSQAPRVSANSVTIGTRGVRYGRLQQDGRVVQAKKGKFLAIPKNPIAARSRPSNFTSSERNANYLFVKRVKVPSRRYLAVNDRMVNSLQAKVLNHLMKGV